MTTAIMRLSRAALLIALGSAVVAILAEFGSRTGWWHFRTGFQLLAWAAYGELGSAVLGLAGGVASLGRAPAVARGTPSWLCSSGFSSSESHGK